MQRRGWILTTLVTLILTTIVFTQARWVFASRAPRSLSRRVELRGHAKVDPLTTEAALRWRNGQPAHWRSLLLQR
jgi:hypothetical protein